MPLWKRTWARVAAAAFIVVGIAVAVIVDGARTGTNWNIPDDTDGIGLAEASLTPSATTVSDGAAVVDTTGPSPSPAPAPLQPRPAEPTEGVSDDNAYRLAVIEVNGRISEELDTLTGLLVFPRYDDPAWSADVTAVLDAMGDSARQARTITAPPAFSQAHATWLEGIGSFEWAAQNLRRAIVGPDEALMRDCIDHMETASARFKSATALMAEVDTH